MMYLLDTNTCIRYKPSFSRPPPIAKLNKKPHQPTMNHPPDNPPPERDGYADADRILATLRQIAPTLVNQRLLSTPKNNIRFCTIVYSEFYYGVCRSTQFQKNLNKINDFLMSLL